ncbi:MAG: 2-oxoglutarate dehydrogenase E1 component [Marinilabiliales bacterium]
MDKFSFLSNLSIQEIEELYNNYKLNPDNVDKSWQLFFEGFEFGRSNISDTIKEELYDNEHKVLNLIDWYRKRGHLFTKTNPVRTRRDYKPTLDIENFGLSDKNLNDTFHAGKIIGIGKATLSDILDHLKTTYCKSIGVEYMFMRNPEKLAWLQQKMESVRNTPSFSVDEKKDILFHINQAVEFERFIHRKFTGQKRFSLEGAESLIPALDALIEKGSEHGINEFVIGMSHRGRLNVLANILKKPYSDIFNEFNGKFYDDKNILGDVKYHLGYSNKIYSHKGKEIDLHLAPNPSHLEAVGPVVQGISRALIEKEHNHNDLELCPVLIHGDAAIAGQGVVYELIQMSKLKAYRTGGTIHFVINNQVGFTTNYTEARSSTYCTDIAKVIKSPIFHVNGDDPEALVYVAHLALEYRQKFHSDVFIDILCYRKYGHNESDEPRFTQPTLYKIIEKHPDVFKIYSSQLIAEKVISTEDAKILNKDFHDLLEYNYQQSIKTDVVHVETFVSDDKHITNQVNKPENINTSVDIDILQYVGNKICYLPEDKNFFDKIKNLVKARKNMLDNGIIDWAMAELLAYGTLVYEGNRVRISGQDSERGTFSHRHASYVIDDTTERYYPLKHISENQAEFNIYNSLLSEYGVLGFEYGYALMLSEGLTVWEAQFGDFHNVAQVIIDQYIASAQEKWNISNGLVLFLPHGYEGQGPEHSSARIERLLTLCANNNIQVAQPTTPSNFFHLLRRQVKRNDKTPLIVFTPKSLLRHPLCKSELKELSHSKFKPVIDDLFITDKQNIKRVVLCSGKIYYDLHEYRIKEKIDNIALIRIEELYPFPALQIENILKTYSFANDILWVQDEPANMGAWLFIKENLKTHKLLLVSRKASGSPATGLYDMHLKEKEKLISKTFQKCNCDNLQSYCGMNCID